MERNVRKPVGPAHILWNIVADNDVFTQLKKGWNEDNDKLDKKRDKKRAGEYSLVSVDEGRLTKRKQPNRIESVNQSTPIGMVPWTKSKMYTKDIIGLHEEILDLYNWLCPRNWEIRLRAKIIDQIKKVVKEVWPGAKVRIFGSTRTKLFLPTSDLDIVVSGFEHDAGWDTCEPNHPTAVDLLVLLRKSLIARNVTDEAHSVVIDKAQVPIVKLTELRTKLSVDITFSAASSINAVKFVNDWQTRCFHTLRPLAFVLKQFIAHRELNEVFHGGLSSYGLILMLINFFQLHERGQAAMSKTSNLGVLLLEFLELYGINFNYRVVGIDASGPGSRFARRDAENDQQQHLLSVLDPFNKDNDVTRGSFAFEKVQSAFHFAYCELEALIRPSSVEALLRPSSDRILVPSILSSVMQIHPETVFHRVWAERAFSELVTVYGSACDEKALDWTPSETSSDEGNCFADSFEHDDDKDGPHSRGSIYFGQTSDYVGDAESSISNYGDDPDEKSLSNSPSLFVKVNNNSQTNRHPTDKLVDVEGDEHLDMHRSASMPPFSARQMQMTKVLPILPNAYLPPHAQQEVHKILANAPRAVVIPTHFAPPPHAVNVPTIESLAHQHQHMSLVPQPHHQHFSQGSGAGNFRRSAAIVGNDAPVMAGWGRVNGSHPQWVPMGRRNAGTVSESSSTSGPTDQPQQQQQQPQQQLSHQHHQQQHHHHHHQNQNSQMPRRFHGNMQRRNNNNSNDRYGRMSHPHSYSSFNSWSNQPQQHNHQHNLQQQQQQHAGGLHRGSGAFVENGRHQSGHRSNNNSNNDEQQPFGRTFRNYNNNRFGGGMMHGRNNNHHVGNSYSMGNVRSSGVGYGNNININNQDVINVDADEYNPDEMLSMKIDRKKTADFNNNGNSNRQQQSSSVNSSSNTAATSSPSSFSGIRRITGHPQSQTTVGPSAASGSATVSSEEKTQSQAAFNTAPATTVTGDSSTTNTTSTMNVNDSSAPAANTFTATTTVTVTPASITECQQEAAKAENEDK